MSDMLQRHVGEAIVAIVDASARGHARASGYASARAYAHGYAHAYAYASDYAYASAYAHAYASAHALASDYAYACAVLVWRPASENTIVCCRDRAEALALYENDAVALLPPGVSEP